MAFTLQVYAHVQRRRPILVDVGSVSSLGWTRLIFQTMGNMAIVACEDGDTMALELAYQWAR